MKKRHVYILLTRLQKPRACPDLTLGTRAFSYLWWRNWGRRLCRSSWPGLRGWRSWCRWCPPSVAELMLSPPPHCVCVQHPQPTRTKDIEKALSAQQVLNNHRKDDHHSDRIICTARIRRQTDVHACVTWASYLRTESLKYALKCTAILHFYVTCGSLRETRQSLKTIANQRSVYISIKSITAILFVEKLHIPIKKKKKWNKFNQCADPTMK